MTMEDLVFYLSSWEEGQLFIPRDPADPDTLGSMMPLEADDLGCSRFGQGLQCLSSLVSP